MLVIQLGTKEIIRILHEEVKDVKPFLAVNDIDSAIKIACQEIGVSWDELNSCNEEVAIRMNVEPNLRQWFLEPDHH